MTCATSSTTWLAWTGDTGTAATISDTTWLLWTTSDTSTSSWSSNGTWQGWITYAYVDERTDEQKAADEARWAAEHAETQRKANEALERQRAATDRAKKLLASMLTKQQREQLQRDRFFEVIAKASRRRYRIRYGTHGNVKLLNDKGEEVISYCGQPNGVPTEDAMLAQKLQIEHDEDTFLRLANATRLQAAA